MNPKEILKDLVAFPSISGTSNLDIADYLEHHYRRLGFEVVRIESQANPRRVNLLCHCGPRAEGGLMLSGHMDVVPVAMQNWHSDPFILTEKEGRLIGRGTADMKGFFAAALCALSDFPSDNLKKPLSLLWTYDEEIGCLGSLQAAPLLKTYLKYLPSAALIGEPTDFGILRMHAGHVTVRINAKGKGAHSSDPSLGISAIRALNHVLTGLFELEAELMRKRSMTEYFKRDFVTMNVGEIHGGTAVNIVPDEAYARIGFRPLPNSSIDEVVEHINAVCARAEGATKACITTTIEKVTPPLMTQADTRLEQVLRPLANNDGLCSAQYATDGGNLSLTGIECLIFGPGSIDVAHKANEWIYEHDLVRAKDKIRQTLDRWFFN